jgi:hypothetical protein
MNEYKFINNAIIKAQKQIKPQQIIENQYSDTEIVNKDNSRKEIRHYHHWQEAVHNPMLSPESAFQTRERD